MSRVNDYRRAMNGLRPSPAWRRRTLAAMEEAAAGTRRARPVRHPLRRAAVLAAVFLAAFVGALWFTAQGLPWSSEFRSARPGVTQAPRPGQLERREGVYTFLLAATSPSSDLTDCMMAVTYDSREQTVRLLSLPRDTQIDAVRVSDGGPLTHLNYVYAENGVEALRAQAAGLLGYPIDYYVIIDPQGFVELVDAMGGVEFNVPRDMDYEDWSQDIHIHLDAGVQLLDGAEALGAALFRHTSDSEGRTLGGYPNGDLDRTAVQRELLAAVLERALSQPQHFPDYVSLFLEHVETDLTAPELLELAGKAAGLELPGALEGFLLPGGPGDTPAMYAPDAQEIWELVNAQRFHPYTSDLPAPTPLVSDPDGTAEPPMPDDVWSLPDAQGRDWMFYIRGEHVPNSTEQVYVSAFTELPVYDNRLTSEADGLAIVQRAASLLGTTVSSGIWDDDEGYGRYRAELADGSQLTLLGRTSLNYTPGPGVDAETAREALATLNTPVGVSGLEQSFLEAALGGLLSDTSCRVLPEEAARYPIRSKEEAVALFRSGDYWSTMETAYPERAEILQVTLEYAAEDYQAFFQPVYCILFTQDYWDTYLAEWMGDEADASRFTGVAAAYVPAVDVLDFRMYANDGELHRTPS